jgi:ubiquinone/menaquinone biosynthesis C-methylase UbiE
MTEQNKSPSPPLMVRIMRLFFRLLYHPFAWTYNLVAAAVSLGRWKSWVHSSLDLLKGPRVLELGFGPGHLQAALHARGWQVLGLDESQQMARQAARRLRDSGFAPRLARGLAQALPYPAEKFDCVAATFPTLYIVDPQTLEEISRVLRPGGRLVVLMIAWLTGTSAVERIMRAVFRITAETPPDDWDASLAVEPYRAAGFDARIVFTEPPGSRLLFIIAEKKQY